MQALAFDLLSSIEGRTRMPRELEQESVAIVGIGCHFPGDVGDERDFWKILQEGKEVISQAPEERFGRDASLHRGGFLENVDSFDAGFFGILPDDAQKMDPRHHLLLTTAYEALENAAIPLDQLAQTPTGLFFGIAQYASGHFCFSSSEKNFEESTEAFPQIPSDLLSSLWDLRGPSMTLDTGSSSSLVVLHLACQSLLLQECNLALVGGVSLVSALKRNKISFPSEGCGVIVCKRLSDALRDRNFIFSTIRGSAVGHEGRKERVDSRNSLAQQSLYNAALQSAGIAAQEVDYIEMDGSGEREELASLTQVYGAARSKETPVLIGSAKTIIGDLEAASGMAALIRAILILQHQSIPRDLHPERRNSVLNEKTIPLKTPNENFCWPKIERRRLAAVSSFGKSGTLAHCILEEAPKPFQSEALEKAQSMQLLCLSAKTEPALFELANRYKQFLSSLSETSSFQEICANACSGRAHFPHRLGVLAESPEKAVQRLNDFCSGQESLGYVTGSSLHPLKLAFVFTSFEYDFFGVGKTLHQTQSVFRATLNECDQIFKDVVQTSLFSILWEDPTLLTQWRYNAAALFCVQMALARLLQSWGIEPALLSAHSGGEYPSACFAGAITLEEGIRLIVDSNHLFDQFSEEGGMLAVNLSQEKLEPYLAELNGSVVLAAENSPKNTVASGTLAGIAELAKTLIAQGVKCKKLDIPYPLHSPLVAFAMSELERKISSARFQKPKIPMVSSVTGCIETDPIFPAYWSSLHKNKVQFSRCIQILEEEGINAYLEIGPKPKLLGLVQESFRKGPESALCLPSLVKGAEEVSALLHSLAELYTKGASIRWKGLGYRHPSVHVMLPTYPFQKKKYRLDLKLPPARSDWVQSLEKNPVPQPLPLEDLESPLPKARKVFSLRAELEQKPVSKHRAVLVRYLRIHLGKILRIEEVDEIPLNRRLVDFGLTSLGAVSLAKQIGKELQVDINETLIFDCPTLEQVIQFLLDSVLPSVFSKREPEETPTLKMPQAGEPSARSQAPKPLSKLDQLSEEEAENLLKAKLGEWEDERLR